MTLQQSDAIAKLVIQQEIVTNDYSQITRNSQSTHLIAPLQPSRFQSITKGWRCENQSSDTVILQVGSTPKVALFD